MLLVIMRIAIAASAVFCHGVTAAATVYHVRLRPAGAVGLETAVAFDLSHTDSSSLNRLELVSFSHNGRADSALVEGGPGYGDLVAAVNPAATTTLEGQFFYNSLAVPFDSLGSITTMAIKLTEEVSGGTSIPDEVAMYLIRRSTGIPYPTADELGTGALFAIDITGQPGGELSVFAPMVFIAPDTLALEGSLTDVVPAGTLGGRLRFRTIAPIPSAGRISFDYEVPEPGGLLRLRVYDVAGRQVAEPFYGDRPGGSWTASWDALDADGHAVRSGVYIVHIELGGQSVVRRVVLTR